MTTKLDDAAWHYGGDFPADLPPEAGATHIGMFVAFALLNDMGSSWMSDQIEALAARQTTPGRWFLDGTPDGQGPRHLDGVVPRQRCG